MNYWHEFSEKYIEIFAIPNLTPFANFNEHKQNVDSVKLGDKEWFDKEHIGTNEQF